MKIVYIFYLRKHMKQIRNLIDRKCPNYWVENILSTIRDIRESLGKPIDEAAERAKIIKEYEETADIANSIDIPEKYSNYWFLWYYGDNDFSSASELAVKYVANQYVDLLKQDLHNLAGTVWTYQDYQKKNEDTKKRLKKDLDHMKESIDKRELDRLSSSFNIFFKSDLKPFYNSLLYLTTTYSSTFRPTGDEFDEGFNHTLNYLRHSKVIVGKENILEFLTNLIGKPVTEENLDKTWYDSEIVLCRIIEGEIKLQTI